VEFVLRSVEVEGVTIYSSETIEAFYAELVGKEVRLSQIYDAANAIQLLYRDVGYFLSRALVPVQEISGGKVKIQVIEGYVSSVRVEGDIGSAQERVDTYLQNVVGQRPLALATLERYLLLSRDIPGLIVNSLLRPAPGEPGSAELVVQLERTPYDGMVVLDNIGSTFTGEWELAGSVASNAFTSSGERLSLTALVSDAPDGLFSSEDNQKVVQANGSFLFGSEGQYARILASYGDSNPGGDLSALGFNSKQLLVSAVAGYPFIRSRDHNLTFELGFDYLNAKTDASSDTLGDIEVSRDRLSVLHLRAAYDSLDRWRGFNQAYLGLRQGLPIFNASESGDDLLSRPDGTAVFTSIQAGVSRLQAITRDLAFSASVAGQYAFDDLLSEEEFYVGGIRFGRGYNPKELAGDHGVGLTGELQYSRSAKLKYLQRYQLFGFYDFGAVWDRETDDSSSLASAGAGVRTWFDRNVSLELMVAKPLTRDSQRADGTRDPEVLVRGIARF
jgi:hemolysin activation/secretion protein